jgi:hypothetical protein
MSENVEELPKHFEKYLDTEVVGMVDFQKEIRKVSKDLRKSVRADELKLLNVMRQEEFSDPLKFEDPE